MSEREYTHDEMCDVYDRPPDFGRPATGHKPCNCHVAEIDRLRAKLIAAESALAALKKEYDEEVISHDIEEADFKEKIKAARAELAHVNVLFSNYLHDTSDGFKCLPGCISEHEDACPVTNPYVAWTQIRRELAAANGEIEHLKHADCLNCSRPAFRKLAIYEP